jgi:hypothetical protein
MTYMDQLTGVSAGRLFTIQLHSKLNSIENKTRTSIVFEWCVLGHATEITEITEIYTYNIRKCFFHISKTRLSQSDLPFYIFDTLVIVLVLIGGVLAEATARVHPTPPQKTLKDPKTPKTPPKNVGNRNPKTLDPKNPNPEGRAQKGECRLAAVRLHVCQHRQMFTESRQLLTESRQLFTESRQLLTESGRSKSWTQCSGGMQTLRRTPLCL